MTHIDIAVLSDEREGDEDSETLIHVLTVAEPAETQSNKDLHPQHHRNTFIPSSQCE